MNRLTIALSCLLVLQPLLAAQGLNVVIVEGEGAINNIRQRAGRPAIVQVEDENRRPVAGAVVVYQLPPEGASGTFADGQRTATLMTDEQGRAAMPTLKPNQTAGKVEIRVNASYQGQTARAIMTHFNMRVPEASKGGSGKLIMIVSAVAGAALAGGLLATRKGSPSNGGTVAPPPVPTIGITPGTAVLEPPH